MLIGLGRPSIRLRFKCFENVNFHIRTLRALRDSGVTTRFQECMNRDELLGGLFGHAQVSFYRQVNQIAPQKSSRKK
jgi:hypothetical protein